MTVLYNTDNLYSLIASNAAAQSIAVSGDATAVLFDTTDTANSINVGTRSSNSVAKVPFNGLYLVTASVTFAQNATGSRALFFVTSLGPQNYGGVKAVNDGAGSPVYLSSSALLPLPAGATITVMVVQTSGGALNIGPDANTLSKLSILKVA